MPTYKITLTNGPEETVEAHGFESEGVWVDFYKHATVHDGKSTVHMKQPVLRIRQDTVSRIDSIS